MVGQFDLDFLGHGFDALHPSYRFFSGELVGVIIDMAGKGDDAGICCDADMGRIHAGLPAQFIENGLLEFAIFRHNILQCYGDLAACQETTAPVADGLPIGMKSTATCDVQNIASSKCFTLARLNKQASESTQPSLRSTIAATIQDGRRADRQGPHGRLERYAAVSATMPIFGSRPRQSTPSRSVNLAMERRSRADLRRDVMGAFVLPPALRAAGRLCTRATTAAGGPVCCSHV